MVAEQFIQASEVMEHLFGGRFPQAGLIAREIRKAVELAQNPENPRECMESFRCDTASQCLQGAVYASVVCTNDFDSAMILAVNHSGRSAAVGAMTGAILGARLGQEALPEFYLESLEPIEELRELAADLALGSPAKGLFDDDWDQKYTHGVPL